MKLFNQTQRPKIKRTAFDLTHEKKLTGKMGKLIPILCQETLPGDKWQVDTQTLLRFAPLAAPVMHRFDVYIHYFYAPNRILWEDWPKFAAGDNTKVLPTQVLGSIQPSTLGDYLGLPRGNHNLGFAQRVSDLPARMYGLVWNEYYRDQNLQPELEITRMNYSDKPLIRAWEKDYFTSALPWAQKGSPVALNMEIDYKVRTDFINGGDTQPSGAATFLTDAGGEHSKLVDAAHPYDGVRVENIDGVVLDINDLRKASALQRWLEKNARSGNRYVEYLLAHWGVKSPDASLQRPQYIGGGKTPVTISEVLNMTSGDSGSPVGDMYGHGISVGNSNLITKYCEEHGYIMGIMSIMPKLAYANQGLPRTWTRETITDFYDPDFAHLGEQEIKSQELFFENFMSSKEENEQTFGYQSRSAEYKYIPSTVHGEFANSMEYWHENRKFLTRPHLNSSFIQCVPSKRIFNVEDPNVDECWVQILHRITAVRPIPYFSTPGTHII